MSDMMVPSYRVQRDPSGVPWRMMAVAGGMLAVVAVGAGGYWAFQRSGGGGVPVVEADPRPFKVRPDDPGGLRVPNQNALVLERPGNRQSAAQTGRPAGLVPETEAPNLDLLRAAVAPPPVVAPRPVPRELEMPDPAAISEAAPQSEAVPQTAPAVAPVPRAVATGRVMVQLAAVTSEEGARSEFDRIARRAPELFEGRSPVVQRLERDGQSPLFRLRTSGFADQDSARQFCEALRARNFACIPVR
ncbi:SPOR domain-containing protein [Falsiroseomonas sp. E2-1-a4]|uniref:SPOR domain-containing protein n=1 Tax=Falsiroseomonas sp. E2-1-a4 TaxID=3239299 RepID=UPI003F35F6A1